MKKQPKLLADRLRQPVIIQKPKTAVAGEDSFGTIDYTLDTNWLDQGARRAEVLSMAGREFDVNKQQRGDHSHRLTFRYDSLTRRIGRTWRLRWVDPGQVVRTIQVVDVVDKDEKHIEIIVLGKEATP